jgi:hypothetical protein
VLKDSFKEEERTSSYIRKRTLKNNANDTPK